MGWVTSDCVAELSLARDMGLPCTGAAWLSLTPGVGAEVASIRKDGGRNGCRMGNQQCDVQV